jgi:RNA polymerase sigma-70 factor (ECF subfamily)
MDAAAVGQSASKREEILRTLRERIVGFAASRISRDAAEDLAQEVLLVLHEKYGQVERLEELLPLALRILRFKMMGLHRKAQRRGEYSQAQVEEMPLADGAPGPELRLARRESAERIAAAVRRLGERCRELLRLKLEGRTFDEIRARLGAANINTVYVWDHRCRKHLLELLGGSWEGRK